MQHASAGLAGLLTSCALWGGPKDMGTGVSMEVPTFELTAPWDNGQAIGAQFTCDGEDRSPVLRLADLPDNATHLALLMDDPDAPAGTWVHWLWWDEPARTVIDAGVEPGTSGQNSWGRTGYGGPCPPSGSHRYFIHVYALDGPLGLAPGSDREAFAEALPARAVGHAQVMGTYTRP